MINIVIFYSFYPKPLLQIKRFGEQIFQRIDICTFQLHKKKVFSLKVIVWQASKVIYILHQHNKVLKFSLQSSYFYELLRNAVSVMIFSAYFSKVKYNMSIITHLFQLVSISHFHTIQKVINPSHHQSNLMEKKESIMLIHSASTSAFM